jgi:hypothetical protein
MNSTLTEAPKMYETENDISQKRRSELNALMNQRLADAVDLQTQMKQAHWNVKGPSFIGLHELFDKVDEAVESYVDMSFRRGQFVRSRNRTPAGWLAESRLERRRHHQSRAGRFSIYERAPGGRSNRKNRFAKLGSGKIRCVSASGWEGAPTGWEIGGKALARRIRTRWSEPCDLHRVGLRYPLEWSCGELGNAGTRGIL